MVRSVYAKLNNRKWIEDKLDEGLGIVAIAKEVGCHYTTIQRAIKRQGLSAKIKRTKHPQLLNKEWLRNELTTKSYRQIAKELGTSTGNVADFANRHKIRTYSSDKSKAIKSALRKRYPEGRTGELASNWRGGRQKAHNYIMVYMPGHPRATNGNRVFEHILVAEKNLGRHLDKDEIVHHINGNKLDNQPENLQVVKRSEHAHQHFTSGKGIQSLNERIRYLERILDDHAIKY